MSIKCTLNELLESFSRDVTKFEFERWRISQNFTAFDIRRMLKLPSRRMRIREAARLMFMKFNLPAFNCKY